MEQLVLIPQTITFPLTQIVNAVKEGALNLMRRAAGKKLNYLSYTYYYSSFYNIMNLFFDALKNGSEFPISLDEELNVMQIIDSAYRLNEMSPEKAVGHCPDCRFKPLS